MITLEKKSMVSGKINTMTLDTTKEALVDYYEGKSGYIQDAFPHLSADEREFIKTGITPDEWDEIFPPEEEDEDDEED